MTPHMSPERDPGTVRPDRPRTVDLAVGAIVLRCVLALAAAAALFGAKDEVRRNAAKLHPEWSAATVADKVDSELRSNLVLTLLYIGLVLLTAKFVRDGRNWARWLYAFVSFLVAGDVLRVAGFFSGENLLFRLLSGLTGLAAVAAIVLLFLPASSAYFRPAGATSSPLGALFGGRAAMAATRRPDDRPGAGTEPSVSLTKPASTVQRPAGGTPAKRQSPRAKSRKQAPQ